MPTRIYHKIQQFAQLPAAEQQLLLAAAWGLMKNGMLLFITSRHDLSPTLLSQPKPTRLVTGSPANHAQILRMVRRAGRLMPLFNTCLVRSLTAAQLCRRHGLSCKVVFGLARDKRQKLAAHAWLEVDQKPLPGYQRKQPFHPIWELNY